MFPAVWEFPWSYSEAEEEEASQSLFLPVWELPWSFPGTAGAGGNIVTAAAILNASASIVAAGIARRGGAVSLTATAQLAALAVASYNGFAVLPASANVIAVGGLSQRASAVLQASAGLVADGGTAVVAAASLSASAQVVANASSFVGGVAILQVAGTVVAVARLRANAQFLGVASASLLAVGAKVHRVTAILQGVATIQAVAVKLSTEIDPEEITGRMYFEVLSNGVIVGAGPITRVFSSAVQHKLDSAGRWAMTIDIADQYASLLQHGREIHIKREGEGTIAKGIIGIKEIAPA